MPKVSHTSPAYIRAQQEWLRDAPGASDRGSGKFFVGSGVKHGLRRTPTYETWANLKRRWSRGEVALHTEWAESFTHFLADMGEKPIGYVLRRIVGRDEYTPATCLWRPARTTEKQPGVDRHRFDPDQPHMEDKAFAQWLKRSKRAGG